MNWLPLTNKLDGKGFRCLSHLPNTVEEFAAWILILEVASPMPVRGVLRDYDGPLIAEDLADKTGFLAVIFESAFEAITCDNIGWMTIHDDPPQPYVAGIPAEASAHRKCVS